MIPWLPRKWPRGIIWNYFWTLDAVAIFYRLCKCPNTNQNACAIIDYKIHQWSNRSFHRFLSLLSHYDVCLVVVILLRFSRQMCHSLSIRTKYGAYLVSLTSEYLIFFSLYAIVVYATSCYFYRLCHCHYHRHCYSHQRYNLGVWTCVHETVSISITTRRIIHFVLFCMIWQIINLNVKSQICIIYHNIILSSFMKLAENQFSFLRLYI